MFRLLLHGEFTISGFTNKELRPWLPDKTSAQVSHLLKQLRVHKLIKKVGQRYKYYLTDFGRHVATDDAFEQLTQPGCVGQSRVAGVNLDNPRMRAVIEAVLALAAAPKGFLVAALALKAAPSAASTPQLIPRTAYRP